MIFRAFHYSWRGAALLSSLALPLVYLGVFFVVLRRAAGRFVSADWARLTAFIALFGQTLTFKFAPGQVDHHGLEVILMTVALGCMAEVYSRPAASARWAVGAGGVFALALAIGLETLPWMMIAAAVTGMWALVLGKPAARSSAIFGGSLFLSSALCLAVSKPIGDWAAFDLLSFSSAYVALAGGIALALGGAAIFARLERRGVRVVLGGLSALALGALYLWRFPALLQGPYGAMNPKLAAVFFSNIEEAMPMVERWGLFKIAAHSFVPLLALGTSAVLAWREKEGRRWAWLLLASCVGAAYALTLFYQIRVHLYACLFSIIPLTAFAEKGWAWIGAHLEGRRRFGAEVLLVLLLGPLPTVFLPALQDGRSFNRGVLLFSAQNSKNACEIHSLEKVLNAPPYGNRKRRIANFVSQGPEILFYSPHEVMASPYHTNVRGNLESFDFFSTLDPAEAEKIARRNGIELVALCLNIPDMYLHGAPPHYVALPNGEVRMRPDDSFAGQLAFHKIPAWLREVPLPAPSNYLLFEVQ